MRRGLYCGLLEGLPEAVNSYFSENSRTAISRALRPSGASGLACNSAILLAIQRCRKFASVSAAIAGFGLGFLGPKQPLVAKSNGDVNSRSRRKRFIENYLSNVGTDRERIF